MKIQILTLVSLVFSISRFDESLMKDIPWCKRKETKAFAISSREFHRLYRNLLESKEGNKIENKCPICIDTLTSEDSDRELAILLHKETPHTTLFSSGLSQKNNVFKCPVCSKRFDINDAELKGRILLEKLLNGDLANPTEENKRDVFKLITQMYKDDKDDALMLFLDEKFVECGLKDMILNDTSYPNKELRELVEGAIKIKEGSAAIGIGEFMKWWSKLLKSFEGDSKIIELLANELTKKGISSKIKSLDISDGCFTADSLPLIASLFGKLGNLESLDISNNELDDDMMKSLVDAMKDCKKLRLVVASKNKIGDDVAKLLAGTFEGCKKFVSLNISGNNISTEVHTDILMKIVLGADLKTLTKNDKKSILVLISRAYAENKDIAINKFI